jgi:hypothetical protein
MANKDQISFIATERTKKEQFNEIASNFNSKILKWQYNTFFIFTAQTNTKPHEIPLLCIPFEYWTKNVTRLFTSKR